MSAFAGPTYSWMGNAATGRTHAVTKAISQTGLVLNLDAGVSTSYPGSGTTCTDLAAARTGTLTNGPTFSSSNGGSIVFDGVNDFIDFGDVLDLGTNDMTINVWLRPTTLTAATYYAVFSKGLAGIQSYRWNAGFYGNVIYSLFQGNTTGQETFATTSISTNTWYMMTYVYTRSSSIIMYVNGVSETLTGSPNISSWNGQDFQSNSPLRVGTFTAGDNVGVNAPFSGNISSLQMYFRSLSATEIRQNFNALRGRYGI